MDKCNIFPSQEIEVRSENHNIEFLGIEIDSVTSSKKQRRKIASKCKRDGAVVICSDGKNTLQGKDHVGMARVVYRYVAKEGMPDVLGQFRVMQDSQNLVIRSPREYVKLLMRIEVLHRARKMYKRHLRWHEMRVLKQALKTMRKTRRFSRNLIQ